MIDWFQWVCSIPATDVRVWLCWMERCPFFLLFFLQLRSDTKSSVPLLSHRHKGILVSWVMAFLLLLVFCDFSPAKCSRLTYELTDHTALGLREGKCTAECWRSSERDRRECSVCKRRAGSSLGLPMTKWTVTKQFSKCAYGLFSRKFLRKGWNKKSSDLGEEEKQMIVRFEIYKTDIYISHN